MDSGLSKHRDFALRGASIPLDNRGGMAKIDSFSAMTNSESFSSMTPPGSLKSTTTLVSGSRSNRGIKSRKLDPTTGSPPIPMQVLCPMPRVVNRLAISVVMPPLREAIPTGPGM
jgi:hypothetical protein